MLIRDDRGTQHSNLLHGTQTLLLGCQQQALRTRSSGTVIPRTLQYRVACKAPDRLRMLPAAEDEECNACSRTEGSQGKQNCFHNIGKGATTDKTEEVVTNVNAVRYVRTVRGHQPAFASTDVCQRL